MVTQNQHPASGLLSRRGTRLVLALALVFTLALLFAAVAVAADSTNFKLQEKYTVTVDKLGTGHVIDVLNYDATFFNKYVDEFTNHPSLIKRDWEQQISMGQVVGFRSKVDPSNNRITLTWTEPGYAVNMGDHWEVGALGQTAPDSTTPTALVFNVTTTGTADPLTYWQTTDWTLTKTVKAPAGASGIKWHDGQNHMVYALAYVPPAPPKNFFQSNKSIFLPLGGIIALVALGGIALLLMRGRPAAATAIGPGPDRLSMPAADFVVIAAPAEPFGIGPAPPPPGLTDAAAPAAEPPAVTPEPAPAPPVTQTPPAAITEAPTAAPPEPFVEPATKTSAPVAETPVEPAVEPAADLKPNFCASCGRAVGPDDHFCPGCGKTVS